MRRSRLWLLPLLVGMTSVLAGVAQADDHGPGGPMHRWFHHHHRPPQTYYQQAPVYNPAPQVYYQSAPPVYYEPAPPVYYQAPPPVYYQQPAPYSAYGKHTPAHECRTQAGECQLPGPEFAGHGCKCFFQGYGNVSGVATP